MNNTTLPRDTTDAPAAASGTGNAAVGRPAFGYGVSAHAQYAGHSFDAIETELSQGWNTARGVSALDWGRAKNATRDAWNRVSDAAKKVYPAT